MTTNHPKDKNISVKVSEGVFLLVLDDFLERADGLRVRDLDQKDTIETITKDPAIEFENVRHVKSGWVREI
jgi:hypothetical protein